MGHAFAVFRLKTRQYLGPILTNRKRLATTFLPLLLFVLFAIPLGSEFARPGTGFAAFMDPESVAAFLSIFLTISLVQGLGGGILAHPSEVDFVLTTPIRPRRYLAAEYGFQILILHIFLLPFLVGFAVGVGLGSGAPVRAILVLAIAEIFLLLPSLVAQSIGALVCTNHRWVARGFALSAALVLLLPALHFLVPFPLRYTDLLGPPQLATALAFGLAREGVLDGVALLGLLGYVGAAAGAWLALSGREFFPGVRPLMVMSFGQPMDFSQMARLAAERKATRRTRFAVDVFLSKLPTVMTKLQMAKWTRSGALPAAIAMLVLFGIIGLVFAPSTPEGGSVSTFAFSFIPILLPSLLAVPTFTFERDRLWAYTIIPGGMSRFFQALFASQVAVAIPLIIVPAAVVTILTNSFSASGLLALAGAAFGSACAATWFLTKMDVPLQTFSLRPLLFLGACGLGALTFSIPALLVGPLVANDLLGSVGLTLGYAVGLFFAARLAHRWIGRAARSFILNPEEREMPATAPLAVQRDVERAYGLLAKATFGMILFGIPILLAAIQPLWYRDTGPPPPMSPLEAAAAAVLSGGIVLLVLVIVILLTMGYRRLVHRAMAFLSPEAQKSARISRGWFRTFWGLIGASIPLFFASIGAAISEALESLRLPVLLIFAILPSALLIALTLFLAYAVWGPLPMPRRTLLRRIVWLDLVLIGANAAGIAVLTAYSWRDIVASEVIAPAQSPWTTLPAAAFNLGTLVALYLAFRWVRRHPPVRGPSAAPVPLGPPSGVVP